MKGYSLWFATSTTPWLDSSTNFWGEAVGPLFDMQEEIIAYLAPDRWLAAAVALLRG